MTPEVTVADTEAYHYENLAATLFSYTLNDLSL